MRVRPSLKLLLHINKTCWVITFFVFSCYSVMMFKVVQVIKMLHQWKREQVSMIYMILEYKQNVLGYKFFRV